LRGKERDLVHGAQLLSIDLSIIMKQ
jgi:hypothetical protein